MDVGNSGDVGFPGIHHDELSPVGLAPHEPRGGDGMGRGGVGTNGKDAVGFFQFLEGVGRGAAAEGEGKTCHRGTVSEAGAVIHVVGSDGGADELLEQVVFLVGASGGGQAADAFGTVGVSNPAKLPCSMLHGLLPAAFRLDVPLSQEGFPEPVGVLHEFVDVPSLDAQFPLIGRAGFGWQGAHDPAVQDFQHETASAGAIGTRGDDRPVIHPVFPSR